MVPELSMQIDDSQVITIRARLDDLYVDLVIGADNRIRRQVIRRGDDARRTRRQELNRAEEHLRVCEGCPHHRSHTLTTVKCALVNTGCGCTNLLTGNCPEGRWANGQTQPGTAES